MQETIKKFAKWIIANISLFIFLVLISFCVVQALIMLVFPSMRRGIYGIGLPSLMTQYTNDQDTFTFIYPENWELIEMKDGDPHDKERIMFIFVAGRRFPSINIAKKSTPTSAADEVAEWGKERASRHSGFLPGKMYGYTTKEHQGQIFEYMWKDDFWKFLSQKNIRCRDWYVLQGTEAYALSLCSEEKMWPEVEDIFMQIINSFSVRKSSG